MRDYLIRVSSLAAARTELAGWTAQVDDGNPIFDLPTFCDILPVDAYTAAGSYAIYDATGETMLAPAVPPTLATGKWFVVSLDGGVTLPAAAASSVKAEGDRAVGLVLPAGIVGLSTMWAGMTVTPTP